MLTSGSLSNYSLYSKIDSGVRWARIERLLSGEKSAEGVTVMLLLPEGGSDKLERPLLFMCGPPLAERFIRKLLFKEFEVYWNIISDKGHDKKCSVRLHVPGCSSMNCMHVVKNDRVFGIFAELHRPYTWPTTFHKEIPQVPDRFFRISTPHGFECWEKIGRGVSVLEVPFLPLCAASNTDVALV